MSSTMKKLPINEDVIQIVEAAIEDFFDTGAIGADIAADVKAAIQLQAGAILADYSVLGYHVLGRWPYDTDHFDYTGLTQIVNRACHKYYPYMKVLTDEFTAIAGRESYSETYSNTGSGSTSLAKNDTKTKAEMGSSEASGRNVTAREDSPFSSVPAEPDNYSLTSPSDQSGGWNSNEASSTLNVTETDAATESGQESKSESGSRTHYTDSPERLLAVLRFNVDDLNATKIAYRLINSITDEINTIY